MMRSWSSGAAGGTGSSPQAAAGGSGFSAVWLSAQPSPLWTSEVPPAIWAHYRAPRFSSESGSL